MRKNLFLFLKDETGAHLVEYALLFAFIVIVVASTITPLGSLITNLLQPFIQSLGASAGS